MKRFLVVVLAVATSVAVAVPAASGAKAKPLKATPAGWYVFDGVGSATSKPNGGTYSRCVNDPNTPPVIGLGGRYNIKNKSAPKGLQRILNGPGGIHIVHTVQSGKTPPGNGYVHRFDASDAGKDSFGPGKYTFRLKVGKKSLTSETIKLVDNPNC
jgi:opacity protein-like surface antigen